MLNRISCVFTCAILLCACSASNDRYHASPAGAINCESAQTAAEVKVCGSEKLRSLDRKMASLYRERLKYVDEPQRLREDQRRWVRDERNDCGSSRNCLVNVYNERIQALRYDQEFFGAKSARGRMSNYMDMQEWAGNWIKNDQNVGYRVHLRVRPVSSRLASFRFASTRRGREFEMMGEFKLDGNIGKYEDGKGENSCRIRADFEGTFIEIQASRGCRRYTQGLVKLTGDYQHQKGY